MKLKNRLIRLLIDKPHVPPSKVFSIFLKPTFFRWLILFVLLALLFICRETTTLDRVSKGDPPVLYTAQLHPLYIQAIESAKKSIVLIIYSLTDKTLLQALNRRAENGVAVRVLHDPSTCRKGLSPSIKAMSIKVTGLMHQKILIVDDERIWMGSANFTPDSLKLDDNLVVGLYCSELVEAILGEKGNYLTYIGEQLIEYWSFPQMGKEGLERLISLIDQATQSVYVAMFTWTHPQLTEAIIRAHNRGICVKVVLDPQTAKGASAKACQELLEGGVEVAHSSGLGLFHHKHVWIDQTILVNGSANWTRSAFSRNWDYFLILHNLTEAQHLKMKQLWKSILSNKKHLAVLRQRPIPIGNPLFKPICACPQFV